MRVAQAARWLGGGVTMLTLACGGGGDGSTGPSNANVSLDASHAASDSIGVTGGTITATSGSGVQYTLRIPAGALESKVKITLTPITGVKSLPVSGGFAAGADFQPAGLHFALPARLSVSQTGTAPSGMQLIALTFERDADSLGLTPIADSSGTKIVFLTRFSGASFAFGTTADVQALTQSATTASASQPFINQIVALGPISPPGNPAALPILQQWFTNVILPDLQGAGTDAELILAVGDYDLWATVATTSLTGSIPIATLTGPPQQPSLPALLASLVTQASAAAAPVLRAAIAGNNSTCLTQRNLQAMLNEFFWQDYASYFHVATSAEHLDRASIITNLCGQVRLDSSKLVDPLPAGQGESFDMVWGVLIGQSPPVIPAEFSVTVNASGATVSPASGLTGPNPQGGPITKGFFTTVVNGSNGATANLSATACFIPPGETTPIAGLCHTEIVTRHVTGECSGVHDGDFVLDPTTQSQLAGVTQINGILQIHAGLSAVDLPCLSVATGGIELTEPGNAWLTPGTLRLTGLAGGNELFITNTNGLKSVTLPPGVAIGGQILEIADNADLDSLTPIGSVGAFSVIFSANPKMQQVTFGDVQSSEVGAEVTIGGPTGGGAHRNDALTTVHLGSINGGGLSVLNNAALTQLVTGALNVGLLKIVGNPGLSDLSHIPSGSVQIFQFSPDNGFSESAALAFANRIGVTDEVCQLDAQQNGCAKIYTGPPWH